MSDAVPHPIPAPLAELIAARFRVLADATRIRLLDELRDAPATVKELTERTGATQQNVSKHLGVLHQHGMVARERRGTSAVYSVADEGVYALCEAVCGGLREHHASVAELLATG